MIRVLVATLSGLLAAAQAAVAAEDATLFDRARQEELERHPSEAIDFYIQAITGNRFDLPRSAPALVELVTCFQLLKDDPATAKRYADVCARLLPDPPKLDGISQLPLEAAEDDLLWSPWPGADGKPVPAVAFTIDSGERKRSSEAGVKTSQLQITLAAPRDIHRPLSIGIGFDEGVGEAVATADDGHGYVTEACNLWVTGDRLQANFDFKNFPESVTHLKRLTGTVTLSAEREWTDKFMPLQQGEIWEMQGGSWRIEAVRQSPGQVTVELQGGPAGGTDTASGGAAASSESSASSASSSGGGAVAGGGPGGELWLVDAVGHRVDASSSSGSGDGHSFSYSMSFAGVVAPATLVVRTIQKTSTRKIPFSFDGVDLP